MDIKKINVVFVYVEDIEKSKEFYQDTLGLGKPRTDTTSWVEWKIGGGSDFAIHKADQEILEGSVPARSTVKFSLMVDDIREAYNELFEKGIKVLSEPKDGPGFMFIEFLDLDGNVIRLLQETNNK